MISEKSIIKNFGQFSVCACKRKWEYEVFVTDGDRKISISLLPEKDEISQALDRLEKVKKEYSNLDYFKLVVAGSLLISMKQEKSHKT